MGLPRWSGTARSYVKPQVLPRWSSAAADYAVAVAYSPEDPEWRRRLVLSLLAAGDYGAARQACSDMLEWLDATTPTMNPLNVAWIAVLATAGLGHADNPVRLIERTLENDILGEGLRLARSDIRYRLASSEIRGAELYRGRYAEAIGQLMRGEEWRKSGQRWGPPWNPRPGRFSQWPIIVWAATKRPTVARPAPKRPGRSQACAASPGPDAFWDELEMRLVQTEAEAVILYDPIFPGNPFAH